MSRSKKLPDDVKKNCLSLVQGYQRRKKVAENPLEIKRVQAVEFAMQNVGKDLSERDRDILLKAILKSCTNGRKYPFERLMVEGMERSCFYDRRMRFLMDIAKYMDMI